MRSLHARILTVTAAALALLGANAAASTLEVAPTTIELGPGKSTAVLYVSNRGSEATTVQIQSFDWRQLGGSDQLTASDNLLVSPPMARIKPGARQTIRLLVAPGQETQAEQTFRLLVSELPEAAPRPAHGIRILLQFSVPVFVARDRELPARLEWDGAIHGGTFSLTARNFGARHVKLAQLALIASADKHIAVSPNGFNYILAGASHSWNLAKDNIIEGETLHIEGNDESAGAPVSGTLVVHR